MATNGYGAPPAYHDAPPSYANVQSGTPAQPVQYGQPVQYTQPAQPVQPAAGQIVYVQGQPMMVAQVIQQPAQGQMGQVSSVPMQLQPQVYYPNVGGAAPTATVAYNNNYNNNNINTITTAPGGIPSTVGSGINSTGGGEPGGSVVTTAVVVGGLGQGGRKQGYSCSGPSGLDGDTRTMSHYCGVLITVCIMATVMVIMDAVDELAVEEFNYYDDYYYSSYYDYSYEFRFGAEEVEITYNYWYSWSDTQSYSSLCNDDDNAFSDYWCDIETKGIAWITWLTIADLCWLIAIIFLSLIACCGPRGCCSCGNDCGKGCNDKSCCGGFCAKNTAIWALIGYSIFGIIGCIVWISDNPIQDDGFCEDCDIEWGSTWYTALVMAIINMICVVVLALPDCACCRCS